MSRAAAITGPRQAGKSTLAKLALDELFFYRDTDKREVDLVIESASGDVVGIEAKSAATASASDARGLRQGLH